MPTLAISPCHTPATPIYTHTQPTKGTQMSRLILNIVTALVGYLGMTLLALFALYL